MRLQLWLVILSLTAHLAPALAAEPTSHIEEGVRQAEAEQYSAALDSFDRAIRQDAKAAQAYYWRGRVQFCLGRAKAAVADFDQYVKLRPEAESQQWERGIALYYAGEYERGAKQFELYQTYHDNDVENSTWRYLCVARSKGIEEARKTLLPIKNDRRVPMMAIFDLYGGKSTPDDVFAAANAGSPEEREANARQFYAHLYVGLWYEAAGKADLAAKHVAEARKHKIGHYMWNVADVHVQLRQEEAKAK